MHILLWDVCYMLQTIYILGSLNNKRIGNIGEIKMGILACTEGVLTHLHSTVC